MAIHIIILICLIIITLKALLETARAESKGKVNKLALITTLIGVISIVIYSMFGIK